jgi:hypothetical protein
VKTVKHEAPPTTATIPEGLLLLLSEGRQQAQTARQHNKTGAKTDGNKATTSLLLAGCSAPFDNRKKPNEIGGNNKRISGSPRHVFVALDQVFGG